MEILVEISQYQMWVVLWYYLVEYCNHMTQFLSETTAEEIRDAIIEQ